jgi:hypothetical protein
VLRGRESSWMYLVNEEEEKKKMRKKRGRK